MSAKKVSPAVSIVALVLAVAVLLYLTGLSPTDEVARAITSLVIAALCLFAAARRWGGLTLCAPVVYLSLLILFHFGLVWTLGALGEPAVLELAPSAASWIRSPYMQPAVELSCLAVIVFAAVSVVLAPSVTARNNAATYVPDLEENQRSGRVAPVGIVIEFAGLLVLLVAVLRAGGLGALSGGYLTFLENTQSSGVAYAIWAIGLGACLSQLGRQSIRQGGLLVFTVFAVVMFPLGLRGSVLFPAVVLLTTRARMGRHLRPAVLVAGSVVILVFAAAVRQTRVGGTAGHGPWYREAMSTVTELGFSLRPMVEVLRWEDTGIPHSRFVTFLAVPIRLVERVTGWHGGSPVLDERLFNVKVNELAGPIGGSPVAEGYDAAGLIGVIVVMVVVAVAVCLISRNPVDRTRALALFPVVLLPLTIAVRNSFAPVLPQIIVGGALVWLAARTRRRRDTRSGPTASPAVSPAESLASVES